LDSWKGWDNVHVPHFLEADLTALSHGITVASPQLPAEAVVALGDVWADDKTKSPQYAIAALLAALADGLCEPHSGSSSSTESQGRLSQVSDEVVLELTATMPVLLHLAAYFIRERDVEDVDGANVFTVYIDQIIATAGKLTALAHCVAVYSSSIQPANASTAQLLQCNAALDDIQQEVATLVDVLQYEGPRISSSWKAVETATAVCKADWPDCESRQLFSLLVQRLATQQQPAAGLVMAVAEGLEARCCSPFDVSHSDIHAAVQTLAGLCLADVGLSAQELADLLDAADVLCEGPEDDQALQSLVEKWQEELPRLLHCKESECE
jgi:hypothetical protein